MLGVLWTVHFWSPCLGELPQPHPSGYHIGNVSSEQNASSFIYCLWLSCERDPAALPRCEFASLLFSKSWVVQEGRPGSPRSLQAPQPRGYPVQHMPSRLGSSSQIAQVTKSDSKAGFFRIKQRYIARQRCLKSSGLTWMLLSFPCRLDLILLYAANIPLSGLSRWTVPSATFSPFCVTHSPWAEQLMLLIHPRFPSFDSF